MTINEAVLNPFSTNECSTSTPPENVRKPPVFSKSPNLLEKMVFYYHGTKIFGHFFSGTNWIMDFLDSLLHHLQLLFRITSKLSKIMDMVKKRAY